MTDNKKYIVGFTKKWLLCVFIMAMLILFFYRIIPAILSIPTREEIENSRLLFKIYESTLTLSVIIPQIFFIRYLIISRDKFYRINAIIKAILVVFMLAYFISLPFLWAISTLIGTCSIVTHPCFN